MALIGEIAVNIVAKTGAFTKGMNAVRKQLNTTAKALGAFGGAITGGFALAVKSFVSLGDQINDMATRTGFAVETLSALDFAASQSGTSLAALETGIKGMAKAMLTAQQGSTTMVDNFAQLGLTIQQLQAMSPDQQFLTLAERLSRIEDPTQKAALAMKVFGRSGADLIPLLQDGEKGIVALTEKAKSLGVVWSKEDVAAAAALDDAMNALWTQLRTVFKEIAVGVSGPLLEFLDRAKVIGKSVIDWIGQHKQLVTSVAAVGVGLSALTVVLIASQKAIGAWIIALKGAGVALTFISNHPLIALATALAAATLAVAHFSGALDGLKGWIPGLGSDAKKAADDVLKLTENVKGLSDAQKAAHVDALKLKRDDLAARIDQLANPSGIGLPLQGASRVPPEHRAALAALDRRIAELQGTATGMVRGGRGFQEAVKALEGPRKASGGFLGEMITDVRKAIVRGVDSVTGGRLPHRGFLAEIGGVVNSIGDAIMQLPQQQAEAMQEVTRSSNAIIQKGTQEAASFAAQHRQRQQSPEKKIEKNTEAAVKLQQKMVSALTKIASKPAEAVFSIPAS